MTVETQELGRRVMTAMEVQDFLFREAELVDERRFEEWLELFADDLEYRIPMAQNLRFDEIGGEYQSAPLDVHWIDEGKATLTQRVQQIRTGVHWAEEPLSRTSHLVMNVRVDWTQSTEDDLLVKSRVVLYRNRLADEEDLLVGKRTDQLRRHEDSWLIHRRTIHLDQTVLLSKNLSMLL